MRNKAILVLTLVVLLAGSAVAQFGAVRGKVTDQQGNPMVGVTVQLTSQDTGRKYDLKTDKRGEYMSIGITPGRYNVTLIKEGQTIFQITGLPIQLGEERVFDIDLAKEQEKAKVQLTEEQKKQIEKAEKERTTIKNLNEKLAAANTAQQAGQFDQAIGLLNEAVDIDATREILWYKLGDLQLAAGNAKTGDEAKQHFQASVEAYQKGLAIKPIGAGYNNLGQAYAKTGETQEAMQAYTQAAQMDPANASQYFFNLGAILTNESMKAQDEAGRIKLLDEANAAFDKALGANPTPERAAEAWYQKGANLFAKATTKPDGTIAAPDGTAEAFQKVIELNPDGARAAEAQAFLEAMGAKVESTFKRRKK